MTDSYPTSALIRPRPSRKPTQMHWQKHSAYRKQKMLHSNKPPYVRLLFPVILLLIVLALSGCQVPPIKPCVQPSIPTAPVSQMQQPSQTFSQDVRDSLSTWEKRLTDGAQKP